jgi:hypothetical protein
MTVENVGRTKRRTQETLARTRGQDIIQLRAQGKTYKDIGKIIGLSGSRCRDLELRHIRHLNFHKNYPLIKSWDESVRAAFAAKPSYNPNWARKHHNAIYYFCSRDKPTRKDFADLLYPSLKAMFGNEAEKYRPQNEAIWKGEKDQ